VKQLTDTLTKMHEEKKYNELTFYLEACESGSMFKSRLTNEMKIYAVTAANTHESSWGCYCENPLKLPCLGDLFSVNWMEDSDKENLQSETLQTQFGIVKKLTNLSHVMHFGDLEIWREHVGEFQGEEEDKSKKRKAKMGMSLSEKNFGEGGNKKKPSPHDFTLWPARDIHLLHLMSLREGAQNEEVKAQLTHKIHVMQKKRRYLENEMVRITNKVIHDPNTRQRVLTLYPAQLKHLQCHNDVVHSFHRLCFNLNDNPYALKYVYVLANFCEQAIDAQRIINILFDHCAEIKGDVKEII